MNESGAAHSVPSKGGLVLSPPSPPLNWVVFDLETSGLDNPDILVGVLWSSKTNWTYFYLQHQIEQLVDALENADVVVSYNGRGFDKAVIEATIGRRLKIKAHIDIYEELSGLRPAFERGWKLDDVTQRLWPGASKQTASADVPKMWTDGNQFEVVQHALRDIYLTRSLFEFIRDRGFVIAPDGYHVEVKCQDWWKKRMILASDTAPNATGISL